MTTKTDDLIAKLTAQNQNVQDEAAKIYPGNTASIYGKETLFLLYTYLNSFSSITTLDSNLKIAQAYETNFVKFDTTSFATIKSSATAIYNRLTGSNLSEEQFVKKTLGLIRPSVECLNCVAQYGLKASNNKC